MDAGRLAREAQIAVAAVALLTVGFASEHLSLLVVLATVTGALYLSWRGLRPEPSNRDQNASFD